jgi:DNA-binding XRE family transcriptional regulator
MALHTATNRIASLREKLGVTQKVMARILGVTERTVIDLEAGRPLSEGIGRRVTELDRLQRALGKVVRIRSMGNWLVEPNDAFDGQTPADLIARGHVDQLWQMIFELRAGVAN